MDTTSLTLIDKLRHRDDHASWSRFVGLYTPLLLSWVRRNGFQDADAEDVVQEMLVKLLDRLPEYTRGEGQSFRGWLFRVCQNTGHDYRVRKATRRLGAPEGLSGVADPTPLGAMEEAEYRRRLVDRALELIRNDFEPRTWDAFRMVMIDGRPAADVGAELGMTPNAVHGARFRVFKRLEQEVNGLLD
jgi:RNA polymerase sigma-70 factor (ECF subfamily)